MNMNTPLRNARIVNRTPPRWPRLLAGLLGLFTTSLAFAQASDLLVPGPDGRIVVDFRLNDAGAPRYSVRLAGATVIEESKLGVVRADADLSSGLRLLAASPLTTVRDEYELLTGKRRHNVYLGQRRVFHLASARGAKLNVVFQVSNDGVAVRYHFPETYPALFKIEAETTSFRFPAGTRAWLQPISVAKTGFEASEPSYERYSENDIPVGTPSPTGAGWVFPALFRAGDTWVVLSETGVRRNYCGSRLAPASPGGEYTVGFPDAREINFNGPSKPESSLPWTTPWRLIALGSLKTVAESTLGTDLADPPAPGFVTPDRGPGRAAWSWALLKDPGTVYETQKQFIDYAADMGWRYSLIDAEWPKQIGEEKIRELVRYGRGKNVGILLWYNSAGDWNTTPFGPRDRMLTHESRIREFRRLADMGVAGIKVDFFGGDGQSVMAYYHDIFEDAAPFGLLLNCHGTTLPRGWQRTYPHLMTMEAVRGFEHITFTQEDADRAPDFMSVIPFTRNIFDPMDFTPMVLDRVPDTQRRTTSAFELATAIVFTSGIQHYAEIPAGMAKAPEYVRAFLRTVPDIWDDSRLLAGNPGKFAVFARQGNGRWFVAGINSTTAAQTLTLDLKELGAVKSLRLITDGADGGNMSFREETVRPDADGKLRLTVAPRGGFVGSVEP